MMDVLRHGPITPKKERNEGVGETVTWVIQKGAYTTDNKEVLPMYRHRGYCYKAAVAGSGSIDWYIHCSFHNASRPCPVQGVRHVDGRLLMLRPHNHAASFFRRSTSTRHTKNQTPSSPKRKKDESKTKKRLQSTIVDRTNVPSSDFLQSTVQKRWKNARADVAKNRLPNKNV